ncbi:hypothetical protein G7007_12600 [Pseudomonas entomophila]|uniref:hypothetical protein n=1 Tax=Pseudomonas entomophila TaxID=312306 RepID=UPI0015E372F6|nr:hypothetical protein [Pseudomonas entomophila]MBA1193693.1 hypothetical protein [Pseudomonas entomophila]
MPDAYLAQEIDCQVAVHKLTVNPPKAAPVTSDEKNTKNKEATAAYEQKQNRKRPNFLNQSMLDQIAHDHSRYLKEVGAKSKER